MRRRFEAGDACHEMLGTWMRQRLNGLTRAGTFVHADVGGWA